MEIAGQLIISNKQIYLPKRMCSDHNQSLGEVLAGLRSNIPQKKANISNQNSLRRNPGYYAGSNHHSSQLHLRCSQLPSAVSLTKAHRFMRLEPSAIFPIRNTLVILYSNDLRTPNILGQKFQIQDGEVGRRSPKHYGYLRRAAGRGQPRRFK